MDFFDFKLGPSFVDCLAFYRKKGKTEGLPADDGTRGNSSGNSSTSTSTSSGSSGGSSSGNNSGTGSHS